MPSRKTSYPALADTPYADGCYLAMKARDARFDGRFFTGVTSTGIYCRPVCKVKMPMRENCRFFGHAAQAEGAGFRPCLRCRPELAPHSLVWSFQDAGTILAHQAARLLDDPQAWGADSATVQALAGRLGVSERHLRRIFEANLGVSPIQYLQTRRLLCAKQLLADTRLPITQVALASGFGSVRRFNAAFAAHYQQNPGQMRRAAPAVDATPSGKKSAAPRSSAVAPSGGAVASGILVKLGFRPPYDVQAMLSFIKTRAIAGVETVAVKPPELDSQKLNTPENIATHALLTGTSRTFSLQTGQIRHSGWLQVAFDPANAQVLLRVSDGLGQALPQVIRKVRDWLDLDADPAAINSALQGHFPGTDGLRVPGCLDGFELAVRAVLGQQITVAAARTLAQRLVNQFGEPIDTPFEGLTRLFPRAEVLAQASSDALGALGIVKTRQAAIVALAQGVTSGALQLQPSADLEATVSALKALPGIGDWTAQYIAMRALRWPDAFPAGDVALHKALGVDRTLGVKSASQAAEALSQAWKPWRSYAVIRAWSKL